MFRLCASKDLQWKIFSACYLSIWDMYSALCIANLLSSWFVSTPMNRVRTFCVNLLLYGLRWWGDVFHYAWSLPFQHKFYYQTWILVTSRVVFHSEWNIGGGSDDVWSMFSFLFVVPHKRLNEIPWYFQHAVDRIDNQQYFTNGKTHNIRSLQIQRTTKGCRRHTNGFCSVPEA